MQKFTIIALALLAITVSAGDNFKDVVIESCDRSVNVQRQLTRIESVFTIKNERDTLLREFYLAIPAEYEDNLSLFLVKGAGDVEINYQAVDNLKVRQDNKAQVYKISLESPLKSQETRKLITYEVYNNRMSPLPKKITVHEDQKVVFEESTYLLTPYPVLNQKTIFKLAGSPISYSDSEGKVRGAQLEYKYSTTVSPFSRNNNRIHFENNTPFVVFKEVVKTIEVSHWGNIFIMEAYQLKNEGAEFRGEYSRIDYNHQYGSTGRNALKRLEAKYPQDSWGMHYRDEVGNVSTSKAYRHHDHVALQLFPRYSIFGGWGVNWNISYNLPASNYLSQKVNDDTQFVLKQDFGFPFENIMAEKYQLRIIFPEGAENIDVQLPFKGGEISDSKTFSLLDFGGRPTKVIDIDNVLEYHAKKFTVSYKFDTGSILIEPLYLFVGFVAFFAIMIVLGRIDFSFKSKQKSE